MLPRSLISKIFVLTLLVHVSCRMSVPEEPVESDVTVWSLGKYKHAFQQPYLLTPAVEQPTPTDLLKFIKAHIKAPGFRRQNGKTYQVNKHYSNEQLATAIARTSRCFKIDAFVLMGLIMQETGDLLPHPPLRPTAPYGRTFKFFVGRSLFEDVDRMYYAAGLTQYKPIAIKEINGQLGMPPLPGDTARVSIQGSVRSAGFDPDIMRGFQEMIDCAYSGKWQQIWERTADLQQSLMTQSGLTNDPNLCKSRNEQCKKAISLKHTLYGKWGQILTDDYQTSVIYGGLYLRHALLRVANSSNRGSQSRDMGHIYKDALAIYNASSPKEKQNYYTRILRQHIRKITTAYHPNGMRLTETFFTIPSTIKNAIVDTSALDTGPEIAYKQDPDVVYPGYTPPIPTPIPNFAYYGKKPPEGCHESYCQIVHLVTTDDLNVRSGPPCFGQDESCDPDDPRNLAPQCLTSDYDGNRVPLRLYMDMEVAVLNFEADWLEIAPFDEDTGEWKRANCERKWVQANYLSPVQ